MKKRLLGTAIVIALMAMLLPATAQQKSGRPSNAAKPNIIFILTDDQRWDALGYAGNALATTPEMDRLARTGTYFKKAVVTTPICAASRASILTGLYERTHKYTFETGPIREEYVQQSYPVFLKKAGYHTGFFGKFGVKYDGLSSLFDVADDYDRNLKFNDHRGYFYKTLQNDTVHLTRYTGQQGIDFIQNAPAHQPFCLQLSFSAPHAHDGAPAQFFWQKSSDNLYQNVAMPLPDLADEKYFQALPEDVQKGFNRLRWTWRFDTPEKYQRSVKGYYRMIAEVDAEIGKIRAALKKTGRDKNTVFIIMGDNGYFLGERGLADKWLLYEPSIRVPLIVFDPRNTQHRDIEDMTLNIDVPATMLHLAGVERPRSWHGKSLLPLVKGSTATPARDTVLIEHLWEFAPIPPSEGVRTSDWKYFRYVNNKSGEELYHLKSDPQEKINLATNPKYSAVLAALRQKCNALIQQYRDPYSGVPSGLMVDYVREPATVRLPNKTPGFSWVVPAEAKAQVAYQVLVASSQTAIDNNRGDAWNSGQVPGANAANIQYAGSPLVSGKQYFWKVRIWDADNRLSEYSPAQMFQVANDPSSLAATNVFQVERIKPVRVEKMTAGNLLYDFGKDAFANMEFRYTAPHADTLVFHLGEKLEKGRVDRVPGGSIRYQRVGVPVRPGSHVYQLPLKPDVRNTKPGAVLLPDSFPVLTPFRYAELDGAAAKEALADITQLAYFSYFDDTQSAFSSNDTILNKVWDLCKYSIKATTFAGLYVDGDRERIPYEADAYLNQLSHYATDREYTNARRTIEYFMEHPTWPTEWQLHVALMFYQDYLYTGNTDLIRRYYEPLKHKTLLELAREDGLISTTSPKNTPAFMRRLGFADSTQKLKDIVDWPPAQKDTEWPLATAEGERDGYVFTPINTVVNAFFYKNMQIMAAFAAVLGKGDEALEFEMAALKVKKSFNGKLFDSTAGRYVDGEGTNHASLHANMMALAFDMVPDAHKKSVVEFIKSRGMACSVYGAQYLLEGLYNAGEADYALQLMTATHDRSWWNMLRIGSTITLEAWDMKYKPNADWNHAWGAAPANIVAREMWGIKPKTPGAALLSIRPQLGPLTQSHVAVPFLGGVVLASYKTAGNIKGFQFTLPANMAAELTLKNEKGTMVWLNGEKVSPSFDTIRLLPGVNVVEVKRATY